MNAVPTEPAVRWHKGVQNHRGDFLVQRYFEKRESTDLRRSAIMGALCRTRLIRPLPHKTPRSVGKHGQDTSEKGIGYLVGTDDLRLSSVEAAVSGVRVRRYSLPKAGVGKPVKPALAAIEGLFGLGYIGFLQHFLYTGFWPKFLKAGTRCTSGDCMGRTLWAEVSRLTGPKAVLFQVFGDQGALVCTPSARSLTSIFVPSRCSRVSELPTASLAKA